VYDTDGNFLQALDSLEMKTLLPEFMDISFTSWDKDNSPRSVSPWKVVDLGCGTGRTTMKLLEYSQAQIYGLDVSEQMLKIAKAKTARFYGKLTFIVFDVLTARECPEELSDELCAGADSVVSSLVIEHLPLDEFFEVVRMLLNPSGTLLLTNMHSDMGAISQAGFVDPKTGTKIRPKSYFHTIPEVLQAATRAGFYQVGEIREREVTPEMVEILGPRARKWVGVDVWFSICFRRI
jgi:SAM-dependent methyltransferase